MRDLLRTAGAAGHCRTETGGECLPSGETNGFAPASSTIVCTQGYRFAPTDFSNVLMCYTCTASGRPLVDYSLAMRCVASGCLACNASICQACTIIHHSDCIFMPVNEFVCGASEPPALVPQNGSTGHQPPAPRAAQARGYCLGAYADRNK